MILKLEEAQRDFIDLSQKIKELGVSFKILDLENEYNNLNAKINSEGFWDNNNAETQEILKRQKFLSDKIKDFRNLEENIISTAELCELANSENDENLIDEILSELNNLKLSFAELELKTLLNGEYDNSSAIIAIHPGAGGTEAQDWAEMLYRMYCRYAEKHKYKLKLLDWLEGDVAGIKSVSFEICGANAFGYLKGENGVHRLVRISPFNAAGKRQTSYASVEVIPEIKDEDDNKIIISPEEIRVESHRASGAGGQHINKTDSAIRIVHLPTGITVGCQSERSQTQNKETAMRMLKSKLIEIKQREHSDKLKDIAGEKSNIEWGSQIRSYVFMPYTLVTDKRTGYEEGNVAAVMDGDLDGFIKAYLAM